jgi:hypothetical protein
MPADQSLRDEPVTVYISAGNSDDRLTQRRWAELTWNIHSELEGRGRFHGEWASDPVSEYQNACWCVEFDNGETASLARSLIANLGRQFSQDKITWAVARTDFI